MTKGVDSLGGAQMFRHIDGWIDRLIRLLRYLSKKMSRWLGGQKDGLVDEKDGWMSGKIYGWVDCYMVGSTDV